MAGDKAEIIARSACYKLLSLAFLPPGTIDAEALRSWLRSVIGRLPEPHRATLAPMTEAAGTPGDGPDQREYARLFGPGGAVTPYQTEYDPLASTRKGHRLADLLGFYEAFGFKVADASKELPDHIAAELEFMSLLLLKTAHAGLAGLEDDRGVAERAVAAFLADHLASAAAAFAERVEAASGEGFYRFAARVLSRFLLAECALLGLEAAPASAPPREPDGPSCPFPGGAFSLEGLRADATAKTIAASPARRRA